MLITTRSPEISPMTRLLEVADCSTRLVLTALLIATEVFLLRVARLKSIQGSLLALKSPLPWTPRYSLDAHYRFSFQLGCEPLLIRFANKHSSFNPHGSEEAYVGGYKSG
jgi:hypothetical protein